MNNSTGPIVVIIDSLMCGGAQRLALLDINELVRRKIDVRLITLKPERVGDSMSQDCLLADDAWVFIPFLSPLSLRAWWRLWRVLYAWKPSSIITHLWFSNVVGRIASICTSARSRLAFEHNVYDGVYHEWQYALDRQLARFTTRIIAVSHSVRESLLKHRFSESKVLTIQNCIDQSAYQTIPTPDTNIRASLGISPEECVLICVGRLVYQKGIDVLLRVFATLPSGILVLVGDGKERKNLEELITKLHLDDRVRVLGTRRDIPDLLRMANIFVLPSRWEGLPMVILEAMTAGIPIVASAVNGTLEVLTDKETAYLVASESESDLREALVTLMESPEKRKIISDAAKKKSAKYSIQQHVDRLLEQCETS